MNSNQYFSMSKFYEELFFNRKFLWTQQIGHIIININGEFIHHKNKHAASFKIILHNTLNNFESECFIRSNVSDTSTHEWLWSDGIGWQETNCDSLYDFISNTINSVENNPYDIPGLTN